MTGNSQNGRTVHFSHEISRMQCKLYNFLTKLFQSLYNRVSKVPNLSKSICFRQPMIHSYVNMSFSSGFHVTCVHVEIMEKLIKSAFDLSFVHVNEWIPKRNNSVRQHWYIHTCMYIILAHIRKPSPCTIFAAYYLSVLLHMMAVIENTNLLRRVHGSFITSSFIT